MNNVKLVLSKLSDKKERSQEARNLKIKRKAMQTLPPTKSIGMEQTKTNRAIYRQMKSSGQWSFTREKRDTISQ